MAVGVRLMAAFTALNSRRGARLDPAALPAVALAGAAVVVAAAEDVFEAELVVEFEDDEDGIGLMLSTAGGGTLVFNGVAVCDASS